MRLPGIPFRKKGSVVKSLGKAFGHAKIDEEVYMFGPNQLRAARKARNSGISGSVALSGGGETAHALANATGMGEAGRAIMADMERDVVAARGLGGRVKAQNKLDAAKRERHKAMKRGGGETQAEIEERFSRGATNFVAHRRKTMTNAPTARIQGNTSSYNNPRLRPSPQIYNQTPRPITMPGQNPLMNMTPSGGGITFHNG